MYRLNATRKPGRDTTRAEYESHRSSFLRHRVGSLARARDFIDHLLRVHGTDNADRHVYSQVGPLSHCGRSWEIGTPRPLDFVGRLEHFGRDWAALGRRAGFSSFPHDASLGQHAISSGTGGTADRAAMETLLRTDASYLRALCTILSPDFACLGYRMPPDCEDLGALARTCPLTKGWLKGAKALSGASEFPAGGL